MCGIVAATARREVSEILLEGLRRLEYRGYDSAGIALVDNEHNLQLHKQLGRVSELERAQALNPILGSEALNPPMPNASMDQDMALRNLSRLLNYKFDVILPSHGDPIMEGAKEKLQSFVDGITD